MTPAGSSRSRGARSLKVQKLKKGKRLYGAIYELPDGRRCYLAYRRTDQVFRSGEKTISDAVRKGIAAWAIDDEDLYMLRAKGIRFVGVLVRGSGDKYMTTLDNFMDKTKAKILNFESRAGSLQRYLPLEHFRYRQGRVRV
jgi:hypothetical protein